jgi:hypothetical protein
MKGQAADIVHVNNDQYFKVIMGFVGRLMLAILGYDGTYYSWVLDYFNEEPTLRLVGREMLYLR